LKAKNIKSNPIFEDVKPTKILDEYLRLVQLDAENFFNDDKRHHINCPACDNKGKYSFTKNGFKYENCSNCNSLYVSPRPENEVFKHYYTKGKSVEFWATTFYKVTSEARRKILWKPKAKMINNIVNKYAEGAKIIDVGGGYGIFAEEMESISGNPVTIIEPSSDLAKLCREKGLIVIDKFLEDVNKNELPSGPKTFVSFELFEHLHDPILFVQQVAELMNSKDIFVFTTLSSSGIDIQALWENSKSVTPPEHINFFNPYSIKLLLSKTGLDCLEVTTPGKFDIDILCDNRELIKDRFLKTFVTYATKDEKNTWQKMVSKSGWSSHMMVCCQKP